MGTLSDLNNKYNFISEEKDKVYILDNKMQKTFYTVSSENLVITKILLINFTEPQVNYLLKNYYQIIKQVYNKCLRESFFMYECFLYNVRTLLVN